MTSKPLVRRTLATLRSAEFGFFGVVVYTRVQTPRFCGDCCNAGTFLRDFCTIRGLAISWLIVGMSAFTLYFARDRYRRREFLSGLPVPSGRIERKPPSKAKSRHLPIAERKALRRHRGPQSRPTSVSCSVGYRGHASERNLERTCSREPRSSWHCLAI